MELDAIYQLVNSGSYFSRTDQEVTAAINAAARWMYDWIMKENKGMWIKTDTTTIAFVVGQEEYTCPADLQTLLRMRERLNAQDDWRLMEPADGLTDPNMMEPQGYNDWIVNDSASSEFVYYGPYTDAAAAQQRPQGAKKIKVGPIPAEVRQTELVYVVRFVEIKNAASFLFIPDEGSGRYALIDFAIKELVKLNNDSLAQTMHDSGMEKLDLFLATIRGNQLQQTSVQQPYTDDLD